MNPLLDALGAVGDVLSYPGSLVRGLLMGRPGQRASGSQIVDALGGDPESLLGMAGGFLADVATDPLTYLGGALGGAMGRSKFRKVGPRYAGGAEKLDNLILPPDADAMNAWLLKHHLKNHPMAQEILAEIPPGSQFLNSGAEALALKTPQGDVLRLGANNPRAKAIAIPNVEGVNQPTRHMVHGDVEVTRAPFATGAGDADIFARHGDSLQQQLREQGIDFLDPHKGNMGLIGGKPAVIDYGALDYLEDPVPFVPRPGATPFRFWGPRAAAGAGAATAMGPLLRSLQGESA